MLTEYAAAMATDYLKWADRNWGLLTKLMGGHAKVYRATRGTVGHRVPGLPEMLLLDHKGAKSGTHRTTPLVFARDGENTILIASKGGYPKNPAWYYNLKANPDTTIQIGSKVIDVHAREATPEEYERMWKLAVEVYGGYEAYRRRTERQIPLIVLEPR
jgi:F420H(2)-dependent quinone reductase